MVQRARNASFAIPKMRSVSFMQKEKEEDPNASASPWGVEETEEPDKGKGSDAKAMAERQLQTRMAKKMSLNVGALGGPTSPSLSFSSPRRQNKDGILDPVSPKSSGNSPSGPGAAPLKKGIRKSISRFGAIDDATAQSVGDFAAHSSPVSSVASPGSDAPQSGGSSVPDSTGAAGAAAAAGGDGSGAGGAEGGDGGEMVVLVKTRSRLLQQAAGEAESGQRESATKPRGAAAGNKVAFDGPAMSAHTSRQTSRQASRQASRQKSGQASRQKSGQGDGGDKTHGSKSGYLRSKSRYGGRRDSDEKKGKDKDKDKEKDKDEKHKLARGKSRKFGFLRKRRKGDSDDSDDSSGSDSDGDEAPTGAPSMPNVTLERGGGEDKGAAGGKADGGGKGVAFAAQPSMRQDDFINYQTKPKDNAKWGRKSRALK